MEFGYSLLPMVDESSGGNFIDRVVMFRKQFADEMGMVLPSVRLKDSGHLNPNQYEIKIKGESVAIGEVLIDHHLALIPDELPPGDEVDGIDTVEPAFGMPAKWISDDRRLRRKWRGIPLLIRLRLSLLTYQKLCEDMRMSCSTVRKSKICWRTSRRSTQLS